MSSEKSKMQIMKNRLNEATISLHESRDSHDCRTPDENVSSLSTPYSAQRRFGKLTGDYRSPIPVLYYISYVPDVCIPLSSPLTPSPRRKLFDEGVSNIERESIPIDQISDEPTAPFISDLPSPITDTSKSLENIVLKSSSMTRFGLCLMSFK